MRFAGAITNVAALGASAGPSYDAASTAYFAAMSVQPDTTRKGLIDALIVGLKADGVWALLDWLSLVAAHDAQAGRINAKTPAQVATANGTITFTTDRGYAGDGTTGYLDTGIADNAGGLTYALNSATIFAYNNSGVMTRGLALAASGGSRTTPYNAGNANVFVNGGGSGNFAVADSLGLTTGVRSDASTCLIYRNATLLGSSGASASTALSGSTFTALKSNTTFSPGRIAAMGFGSALDATKVAALSARLATYLTATGGN